METLSSPKWRGNSKPGEETGNDAQIDHESSADVGFNCRQWEKKAHGRQFVLSSQINLPWTRISEVLACLLRRDYGSENWGEAFLTSGSNGNNITIKKQAHQALTIANVTSGFPYTNIENLPLKSGYCTHRGISNHHFDMHSKKHWKITSTGNELKVETYKPSKPEGNLEIENSANSRVWVVKGRNERKSQISIWFSKGDLWAKAEKDPGKV